MDMEFLLGQVGQYIWEIMYKILNMDLVYIFGILKFLCYIGFWEMGKQHGIGVKINGNKVKYCVWNKGKITVTLKGLYEIDRYLNGLQKGYYKFFTSAYISKLRASASYSLNQK